MARPSSNHPTDGELEILRVLWEAGPSELRAICGALRQRRQVATTTVATILKVMRQKGLVRRAKGERQYLWSAKVSQQAAGRGMIRKLLDGVFDGSARRMVAHLIEEAKLTAEERQEIRRMLETDAGNTSAGREIPNLKHQIPNKSKTRSTNRPNEEEQTAGGRP